MRMPRLFLSWLLLLVCVGTYAANVRTAGPFSGAARGGSVTVLDDGRIVALGDTAALWDPEQRQWNLPREPELQAHRHLHTATLVANDHIVFAGGLDASGNSLIQQTALSS